MDEAGNSAEGTTATRRTWTVLIAVLAALWIGISLLPGDGGSESGRGRCERLWEENRATADHGTMTRDLYIRNCLETERDLRDGKFDGK
jgi:hypothetical protein